MTISGIIGTLVGDKRKVNRVGNLLKDCLFYCNLFFIQSLGEYSFSNEKKNKFYCLLIFKYNKNKFHLANMSNNYIFKWGKKINFTVY